MTKCVHQRPRALAVGREQPLTAPRAAGSRVTHACGHSRQAAAWAQHSMGGVRGVRAPRSQPASQPEGRPVSPLVPCPVRTQGLCACICWRVPWCTVASAPAPALARPMPEPAAVPAVPPKSFGEQPAVVAAGHMLLEAPTAGRCSPRNASHQHALAVAHAVAHPRAVAHPDSGAGAVQSHLRHVPPTSGGVATRLSCAV